jgi:hypothetical protein
MSCFLHPAGVLGPKQIALLKTPKNFNEIHKKGLAKLEKAAPLEYKATPLVNVNIGPYGSGQGHKEFTGDCTQAYLQTIRWIITQNSAHAKKAIEIITAWVSQCKSFQGANAPLECAWGIPPVIRAIELLKYPLTPMPNTTPVPLWTPLWTPQLDKEFNGFLDRIIIPNLKTRYTEIAKWNNNWILTIQEALMQIALYRDDRKTFDWAVQEFKKSLPCCVPQESGFSTETKRDQCHIQFQIGSMIQIAEMCWHQGIDVYSIHNNRIFRCMEYHAFILNGGVPPEVKKEELKDVWFQPIAWEVGYTHFVIRKKLQMPETLKLLTRSRPEMCTFNWGPGWVHHGESNYSLPPAS